MAKYTVKPTSCEGCPVTHLTEGYAAGSGPSTARLAIVAESAGENEAQQGIPLVGWTGQQVNTLLRNNGVDRRDVYCDNVMRCKPSPALKKQAKLMAQGIRYCSEQHLNKALEVVKPNCILALGEYSLAYLVGKKGIGKRRGSLYNTPFGKVVATYHPAFLAKGEGAAVFYPFIDFDFQKAIEESALPDYAPVAEDFIITPTFDEVVNFITLVHEVGRVAIDIETSGGSWWNTAPLCIGMCVEYAPSLYKSISIPFFGYRGAIIWPHDDFITIIRLVGEVLLSPTITKVLQNEMYDIQVLESVGFRFGGVCDDTMLKHHAVCAEKGIPHDLAFIASTHTPIPYYKDEVKGAENFALLDPETMRAYNCRDVLVTNIADRSLDREIDDYDVRATNYEPSLALVRPLLKIQKRGVLIWKQKLEEYRKKLDDRLIEIEADLKKAISNDFNPRSGAQLRRLLFNDLNLTPVSFTRSREPAVDFDSIMQISEQAGPELEPLFNIIIEDRRTRKLRSTYFDEFVLDDAGRLHTQYTIHVTPTERLSSRNPNLQNIPDGPAKEIFVAAPGYVFLSRDYSQIELRIFAIIAKVTKLLEVFRNGGDPHKANAAALFNVSINEVVEEYRDFAKTFIYGAILYGGTSATVRRQAISRVMREQDRAKRGKILVPSVVEIDACKSSFMAQNPSIAEFQRGIEAEVRLRRAIRFPLGGRMRRFLGPMDAAIRAAYNAGIQGSASRVINTALLALDQLIAEPNGIALQVHDELIMEVKKDEAEKYLAISKAAMERPFLIGDQEWVFPTSAKIGTSWENLEKVKE